MTFLFGPGSRLSRIVARVWTGIVLLLCLWPSEALPKTDVPLIDKWTHLILFGGCIFFWLNALPPGPKPAKRILWAAILVVLYGILIEFLQSALPALGRSGDWVDAVADAIGVVLGIMIFIGSRHLRRNA